MLAEIFYGGIAALLCGSLLPLLFPSGIARKASFLLLGAGCALLLAASAVGFFSGSRTAFSIEGILPPIGFSFVIDRLSAFFIGMISVVALCVTVYSFQYVERHEGRGSKSALVSLMGFFMLSMFMVVASSGMLSFLLFWEIMSLSSFFLVMFEYENKDTRKAGIFYFVMTHLSTVFLLVGFLVLYHATGSLDIGPAALPAMTANLAFLSLLAGFGIKAGVVPFHKWLPYAHPASPSNVSALMSGVMIKVAIYGLVRFLLFVLSPAAWWGVLILAAGTVSALLGVVYALKEHDIKRLLAYHSIENIGIILIGIGLYLVFSANGLPEIAVLALAGSLFHTLNHALFKSLLFMAAGSVASATGTKNIEEMGGIIKRMPYTAALFLVGAVSISALPPFNGFVSELMIFQAFLQAGAVAAPLLKLFLVACLAVFALTSALAAACFVKAFGISFLAVPRTEKAANAREVPLAMLIGPGALAALCILLGVFSLQLFGIAGYSAPLPDMAVVGTLMIASFAAAFLAIRSPARRSETWGCGIVSQNPKMEYTASGFSEPIVTIFKPFYRTRKHIERTFFDSQGSIFKEGYGEIELVKFFEEYLYMPVARAAGAVSGYVSGFQNSSLNSCMLYAFLASILIILLTGWRA